MVSRRANAGIVPLTFLWLQALLSLLPVAQAALGTHNVIRRSHHHARDVHSRATAEEDMAIITDRRVKTILGGLATVENPANVGAWLSTLGPDGKWPDTEVDYATACAARRANWPAQIHWKRILVMAGAWRGGGQASGEWVNNTQLRNATSLAISYWMSRDIGENLACLDRGGLPECPCENPSNALWNSNWFSNVILIPRFAAQTCLVLGTSITPEEHAFCGMITKRSYGMIDKEINGIGNMTAANVMDIAKLTVDGGLVSKDIAILTELYARVHGEMVVKDGEKVDGIRPDGSFGHHEGVIYNGNYGKDFSNGVIDLEIAAAGTQFQAGDSHRHAFETLFEGNKWMIFMNTITKVAHWDFSVIGRMLSFPVADVQASGNLKMNLASVLELGKLWGSSVLQNFAIEVMANSSTANATPDLVGNRIFFTNDYMVHRTKSFMSTLRMYSTRTNNTECLNNQNPLGFHLADGTLYHYQKGDEYQDIFASWDWDLIPGTTVDYKNTPLSCNDTAHNGVESFVGGASDGLSGVSAMRYTNPFNGALKWQKTWFLLESGVYHVMVNILASTSTAPVFSVLDQKRKSGEHVVEGQQQGELSPTGATVYIQPGSIWHDNVGYTFPTNCSTRLNVRTGPVAGNWSLIGTSTQPPTTVDIWAAWLEHAPGTAPVEYTMWPGLSQQDFKNNCRNSPVKTLQNTPEISAIHDTKLNKIMGVFWGQEGGSFTVEGLNGLSPLTISSKNAVSFLVSMTNGYIVASDPSQTLASTTLTFTFNGEQLPHFWRGAPTKDVNISFPTDGFKGVSVTAQM